MEAVALSLDGREVGTPALAGGEVGRRAGELSVQLAAALCERAWSLPELLADLCGRLQLWRAAVFAAENLSDGGDGLTLRAVHRGPLADRAPHDGGLIDGWPVDGWASRMAGVAAAAAAGAAVAVPADEVEGGGIAVAVPLRDAGQILGALVVDFADHRATASELALVEVAAAAVAGVLQRTLTAESRALTERFAAAGRRLVQAGASATSLREAGELLASVAVEMFQAERAGVYLIDSDGVIDEAVGVGITPQLGATFREFLVGKRADDSPVWRRVCGPGAPSVISDADALPVRPGGFVHAMQFRSYIAIPLLSADGPVGLVICGDASRQRRWTAREARVAAQLAWEGALVVDSVRLRAAERARIAALAHQAFHDPLTGLPNRALLMQRLQDALADAVDTRTPLAVLLLDLNNFKRVNDTLGHHIGDALLQQVATRLSGALRDGDTAARLGGDEFAVLLTTDGDTAAARTVAARIATALAAPILLDALCLRAMPSIGIALSPDHGGDPSTLLRHADAAMYTAKRHGLGPTLYDPAPAEPASAGTPPIPTPR